MRRNAVQKHVDGNKQLLLFVQSFFKNEFKQWQEFYLHVKDKYDGTPFIIEVYPNNAGSFLTYRVVTKTGKSLWQSWESPSDVENSFRAMSLV